MTAEVAELTAEDKAEAYDRLMAEQAETKKRNAGPPRFKVVVSDPNANDRTLFSSVSKKRARAYVEQHCPRGQHFFILGPDGSMESYEHERHSGGPQGEDIEAWQEFDRDAYSTPELNPVNTNDPWADAWEGAQ
jgi:hypothetical protein